MRTRNLCYCALVLFATAACDRGAETTELRISGDTLVRATFVQDDKGVAQSAECKTMFAASLPGEQGKATIVGGRITYRLLNGSKLSEVAWDEKTVKQIWPDNEIEAGQPRASLPFGISTSLPWQQMQGTAIFNYKVGGGEARTTAPFLFHCR